MPEDGITVRCSHNLQASLLTSHSQKNPGREYYCCPKYRGDRERCDFFCWADVLPPGITPPQRLQKADQARPSDPISNVTSQKRSPSPSRLPDSIPSLTSSPTRLAQIQAALSPVSNSSQSLQKPSAKPYVFSSQSSASSQRPQSVSACTPHCSPMQPSDMIISQPRLSMDTHDDVFFSSSTPMSSGSSTIDSQDSQFPFDNRTRKRLRLGDHAEVDTSSKYVTSPQRPRYGLSSSPESPCKQGNGNDGSNSQGLKMQRDLNNPFRERAASLREHLQSRVPDLGGSLAGASPSPLAEPTADSIAALVEGLLNVPAYISKLERRNVATEKSNEAKKQRIAQLEADVQMLKARNKVLEETIEELSAGQNFGRQFGSFV